MSTRPSWLPWVTMALSAGAIISSVTAYVVVGPLIPRIKALEDKNHDATKDRYYAWQANAAHEFLQLQVDENARDIKDRPPPWLINMIKDIEKDMKEHERNHHDVN